MSRLPHTWKGWFAAVISSMVGFVAGLATLGWMQDRFGWK